MHQQVPGHKSPQAKEYQATVLYLGQEALDHATTEVFKTKELSMRSTHYTGQVPLLSVYAGCFNPEA